MLPLEDEWAVQQAREAVAQTEAAGDGVTVVNVTVLKGLLRLLVEREAARR